MSVGVMSIAEASPTESSYAQAALDLAASDEFPVELVCPITQVLMHDPVLTVQGNVYECIATTGWLQSHNTDPLTNNPLTQHTLFPCTPSKQEIDAFVAALRKLGPEAAAQLPSDFIQSASNSGQLQLSQTRMPNSPSEMPLQPKSPSSSSLIP